WHRSRARHHAGSRRSSRTRGENTPRATASQWRQSHSTEWVCQNARRAYGEGAAVATSSLISQIQFTENAMDQKSRPYLPTDKVVPGATVLDFWKWAYGELRSNVVRGALAEFLVAR